MKFLLLLLMLAGCSEKSLNTEAKLVASFGDSITQGNGVDFGYIYDLQRTLKFNLYNYAVGGTKIEEQVQHVYNANLDNIDYAIFLTGYNDMRFYGTDIAGRKQYRKNLRKILDYLSPRVTTVYLGTCLKMLPHAYNTWAPYNQGSDKASQIYTKIAKKVASRYKNVIIVDINSINFNASDLQGDLVHFNEVGSAKIKDMFYLIMSK